MFDTLDIVRLSLTREDDNGVAVETGVLPQNRYSEKTVFGEGGSNRSISYRPKNAPFSALVHRLQVIYNQALVCICGLQ